MPAVYVTDEEAKRSLAFLMPGIPVSEGTLPPVQQSLGEVNGVAALLTDLKLGSIKPSDAFWLYTTEEALEAAIQSYGKLVKAPDPFHPM